MICFFDWRFCRGACDGAGGFGVQSGQEGGIR